MNENQKVKQLLLDSISQIQFPDFDPSDLPLWQRVMLGGKSPIEKCVEAIANLPEEWVPHIVEVARAIVRVTG